MTDKFRIAFHTLGCKLNFAETSYISDYFRGDKRFEFVGFADKADVYVINSCLVTQNAEKKCKELIRRTKRKNPEAVVAVVGCYAQIKYEQLYNNEGVDIVLGNDDKYKLPEYINIYQQTGGFGLPVKFDSLKDFIPTWSGEDRTRVFLKIQDGCDYCCSYCIVPKARGRSRSDTVQNAISHINKISQTGIKEIVLTGVNIGDFGRHNSETFLQLLKEIEKIEDIKRVRLSSIEPDLLDNEIIELVALSKKLMPHFHIPLQSGSDKILKEMRRKYNTKLYASKVLRIRELIPTACVAADIIAGFPSESDEDFIETVAFIENLPLSYMHVFKFSKRENTPAAKLENFVNSYEKAERSKKLKAISEKKLKNFYQMNRGVKTNVLFERQNRNGYLSGFTPNYIRVRTPYKPELENSIRDVVLTDFDDGMKFMCNVL